MENYNIKVCFLKNSFNALVEKMKFLNLDSLDEIEEAGYKIKTEIVRQYICKENKSMQIIIDFNLYENDSKENK